MITLPFLHDASYHQRLTRLEFVHHLLGNGLLQAVVQVTRNPACGNALVLHLMHPDRFEGRVKADSFTFHQQLGPELTAVMLFCRGRLYCPHPRQTAFDLQFGLAFADGVPTFRARYPGVYTLAGERASTPFDLEEEMFCPTGHAALLRQVRVTNRRGLHPEPARLFAFLVPNQRLFPEAHYVTRADAAVAGHLGRGEEFLALAALTPSTDHLVAEFPIPFADAADGRLGDLAPSCDDEILLQPREAYSNYPPLPGSPHVGAVMALGFDLGELAPGQSRRLVIVYAYAGSEKQVLGEIAALRELGDEALRERTRRYWAGCNDVRTGDERLDDLYRAARAGLRAAVSTRGRMNAGIWGYNAEWVRDSALASVGAILSGQFEMARAMLVHLLTDLVNPEGLTFGESQWYEPRRAELDMNGQLLHALWTYWVHARDSSLIREHWETIRRVAEFPLRPEFWWDEAAMVHCERDWRERDSDRHGLLDGCELAYQMWVSLGLSQAADLAKLVGGDELAERWRDLAHRIWDAVLHHPRYRLVEDGHLMKRRLLDGTFQRRARARPYLHRVNDRTVRMYPRCLNRDGELEPDLSEAWPIACGLVDPEGELARRTLVRLETLWNQEWDFGGYAMHNVDSEPTKLGPWLLSTYIITRAALEARQYDTVRRSLAWILGAEDGRGYTWWEYRDADPALQIDHGIVPWPNYAEPVALFVHHLLGFRPGPREILIQPHLLPEMRTVSARLRCGPCQVALHLHSAGPSITRVLVNGQAWSDFTNDSIRLPLPTSDIVVEVWLEH